MPGVGGRWIPPENLPLVRLKTGSNSLQTNAPLCTGQVIPMLKRIASIFRSILLVGRLSSLFCTCTFLPVFLAKVSILKITCPLVRANYGRQYAHPQKSRLLASISLDTGTLREV